MNWDAIGAIGKILRARRSWPLLLLLVGVNGWGSPLEYACEIVAVSYVGNDGSIVKADLMSAFIGTSFHVERSTGKILGGPFDNLSYPSTQVIDPGGAAQSFKVLSISAPVVDAGGRSIIYLDVEEFAPTVTKSFVALEGTGTIATGTCN